MVIKIDNDPGLITNRILLYLGENLGGSLKIFIRLLDDFEGIVKDLYLFSVKS